MEREDIIKYFLETFGRNEEELFDGERELIRTEEKDYETDRHHAFEIRKNECALIVVDLQNDFLEKGSPLWIPEALRQIPRVKKLIEACRNLEVPVIYTAHNIANDCCADFYEFVNPIKEGAIMEGSRGSDIYDDIYPKEGERVIRTKHAFDSFTGTDLDYVLRNLGVKTVIICGTVTNVCCESTARSAYFKNYHVVFLSDCNSSHNPMAHDATIRTLRKFLARIMKHDELINILTQGDYLYKKAIE